MSFAGYTSFIEMPGAEQYFKSPLDRMSVDLSKKHPRLFKLFFDLMGLSEKHIPESYFKSLLKTMGDADTEIASAPGFKELFLTEEHEAFRQGSLGVTTDAAVHYVDWGFQLSEILFPIHVFHGLMISWYRWTTPAISANMYRNRHSISLKGQVIFSRSGNKNRSLILLMMPVGVGCSLYKEKNLQREIKNHI